MYSQPITHQHRTAILFLVDCSISMLQPAQIGNIVRPKIEIIKLICNNMIDELVLRAKRGKEIRNYYDIAAIGYYRGRVESLLPGDSNGFIADKKSVYPLQALLSADVHLVISRKAIYYLDVLAEHRAIKERGEFIAPQTVHSQNSDVEDRRVQAVFGGKFRARQELLFIQTKIVGHRSYL